ncbi:hypothetical protein F4604DRAFT_1592275 [Suillus subluteus]|nr:hypothetical protein F4604DRAFT_1592275 [Suillus subluteus]
MYKLNCIVLGNDPNCIFPVDIAQTQTVGDLRKVIKDEKKRQFDHVDADSLKLWKVDLPVDETIEHKLSNLTFDTKKSLLPVAKLSKFFSEQPNEEYLHIVIQGPPALSSGPLHLKLNCIVLGNDPNCIFPVDIAQTQTVGDLRKVIKDEKKRQFDHVDADSLKLWKVDPPVDVTIENLRNLTLDPTKSLSPVAKLSKFFSEQPNEEYLHIVVQPQHTGKLFVSLPPIP